MGPINLSDYERLAKERIEPEAWDYYAGGSEDEVTLRENRAAFERIQLRPRMLVNVSTCEVQTEILCDQINLPVMIAPTALHMLAHTEGECATARAAGRAGTIMVASTTSTRTLEEIAAAGQETNARLWFQLYVHTYKQAEQLVQRAIAAGYRAIVLTIDAPRLGTRERDLRNQFRIPDKNIANIPEEERGDTFVSLTWESLTWLRSLTTLPILVKGVMTAEDAILATAAGVDGIIVSNHGGRQLDGVPATIEVLAEVVEVVSGQCDVYLDGGIRRGTDVLKALALGAKAVFIGRPVIWGLAVNGEEGVLDVLEILRRELEHAMALSGHPTLASLNRSLLRFPRNSF